MKKFVTTVRVGGVNYTIPTTQNAGESRSDWTRRHLDAVHAFLDKNFPEGGWEKLTTVEVDP